MFQLWESNQKDIISSSCLHLSLPTLGFSEECLPVASALHLIMWVIIAKRTHLFQQNWVVWCCMAVAFTHPDLNDTGIQYQDSNPDAQSEASAKLAARRWKSLRGKEAVFLPEKSHESDRKGEKVSEQKPQLSPPLTSVTFTDTSDTVRYLTAARACICPQKARILRGCCRYSEISYFHGGSSSILSGRVD